MPARSSAVGTYGILSGPRGARADYSATRREALLRSASVDWIRKGGALPADTSQELIAALTRTTYSFRGDRLLLEPKDQVKARLGHSPDDADAFALTFAQPVAGRDPYYDRTMEAAGMRRRWRPGQCLVEYDVLKRR